MIGILTIFVVL